MAQHSLGQHYQKYGRPEFTQSRLLNLIKHSKVAKPKEHSGGAKGEFGNAQTASSLALEPTSIASSHSQPT
jgi:hypothetical protein